VAQETAPTFDHLPDPIRERVHLEVCAVDGVSQASGRPIRRRRGSNICRDGRPDWLRAAARAPKSVDWSTAPDPVVNRSQFAEA